jgi:hypothetical protein
LQFDTRNTKWPAQVLWKLSRRCNWFFRFSSTITTKWPSYQTKGSSEVYCFPSSTFSWKSKWLCPTWWSWNLEVRFYKLMKCEPVIVMIIVISS